MISRRTFLQSATAAAAAASLAPRLWAAPTESDADDPLHWVDLRIGTGGHGHTFPGASVPFAAVQLSPDTRAGDWAACKTEGGRDCSTYGWDACAGYYNADTSIMGFSHTHLSGTGCGDLMDFLVMAGTGPVKLVPGSPARPSEGYRSRFQHENEVARPGYYSVMLEDPKVRVELTSTERTGIHRYTFPASDDAWLILDLAHSYLSNESSSVYKAELEQLSPTSLAGGHLTRAWGEDRHCYFTMDFSRQPDSITFYSDDKPAAAAVAAGGGLQSKAMLSGTNLKAVAHFKTRAGEQILVRTGISGVSAEGAARNLAAEQPDFDFDRTRTAAERKWREQLSRVRAELHDPAHKRIFYTALYHMSLGPQLFDDVDGQYRGMDRAVHQLPTGEQNYTTFSLWDTFRAAHPAYTIVQPERVPGFANSLIRMAQQSEYGMPVWPLQGTETGTMTGYHSASVIAEAVVKGFPGIDTAGAYACMLQRANVENYRGLGYYRELGFIPADREDESVSKSFEYCYNDFAVASVAKAQGDDAMAQALSHRSTSYKRYFNPANQFMQPVLLNGEFATPFNPIDLGHSSRWRDYTESNAWQTTFGIMHDPAGVIKLFGGRQPFVTKLDALFTVPSTLPPNAPPDIAGMVGQYAHGNEPSHHIGYLYVYAGEPWKTQSRIRMLLETEYQATPDGIAGNEDVGQMSAWYVMSALGFYAVAPVSATYVIGTPLVEHAVVELGGGRQLEIDVRRKDPSHAYIQSWTLNGVEQTKLWFHHSDLQHGARIVFNMGAEPNMVLGTAQESLPPSLQLA